MVTVVTVNFKKVVTVVTVVTVKKMSLLPIKTSIDKR